MINIDEARELVNNAVIPFPADWITQIVRSVEESIRAQAAKGRKMATIQGQVNSNYNRYHLNAEQLSEVSAIVKQWGFRVDEDFKMRYDGQPLTIDIFW